MSDTRARFFWVWKSKGNVDTVTPPSQPITRREPPGPAYQADVAGWPWARHQRDAKRFLTRRAALDFPRILSGTKLVRVRRRFVAEVA